MAFVLAKPLFMQRCVMADESQTTDNPDAWEREWVNLWLGSWTLWGWAGLYRRAGLRRAAAIAAEE